MGDAPFWPPHLTSFPWLARSVYRPGPLLNPPGASVLEHQLAGRSITHLAELRDGGRRPQNQSLAGWRTGRSGGTPPRIWCGSAGPLPLHAGGYAPVGPQTAQASWDRGVVDAARSADVPARRVSDACLSRKI